MNSTLTKPLISFTDFMEIESRLSIRIGQITNAELVPKSNGLKLTVTFGDEMKTAFTNLGKTHKPEDLIGLSCPFIMNLEPSVIKGVTSEVMIVVGLKLDGIEDFDYSVGTKLM